MIKDLMEGSMSAPRAVQGAALGGRHGLKPGKAAQGEGWDAESGE